MDTTSSKNQALGLIKKFLEVGAGSKTSVKSYDDNAHKYEEAVTVLNYGAPRKITEYVSFLLKDNFDAKILDVGAGSGLLGIELHKAGYTNLYAMDPSQGLLDVAKSKGVYKEIKCQYLGEGNPLPYDPQSYDLLVLAGVMGENQLPVSAINDMIALVRPGGHIVNSFRESALRTPMYQGKMETHLKQLEEEKKWKLITLQEYEGFLHDITGLLMVHQVL